MPAGIVRRILAYLIDGMIYVGLFFIAVFLIEAIFAIPKENTFFYLAMLCKYKPFDVTSEQLILYLIYYYGLGGTIWLLYEASFLCSRLSATPGKIVLGMEVSYLRQARFLNVILRTLVKLFLIYTGIGIIIEFLVMVFNRERRTLHDLAAGTQVNIREFKLDQDPPNKGIWWLVIIALLSTIVFFFKTNFYTIMQDTTEIKYSESVDIKESVNKPYEGIWKNGPKWALKFTYKKDKLYIYDSRRCFSEFEFKDDNTLICKDPTGNEYVIKTKGNKLRASFTYGTRTVYSEFTKESY